MAATPFCDKCNAQSPGLFSCLSARQMARLMDVRVPHTYEPGQYLFYQGNPALAVFCIHQGTIKLSRLAYGGDEHVVGTRGADQVIGYRAVLAGRPYFVSARPLERSIACTIPRETFLELLQDNAQLAFALLIRLAGDSLATEDQLLARKLERVLTRFAQFLMQRIPAERKEPKETVVVPLLLSREEIAHLIDTTPETLSRTVGILTRRGVLEPHRHDIQVLDIAALERLARLHRPSASESPAPA